MKPTNPYRIAAETLPIGDREIMEARRLRFYNGANNVVLSLYNYDPSTFRPKVEPAPAEHLTPQATVQEPAPAAVPDSLNNVVNMMDRAEQRDMTDRELRIAEAMRAALEIHDEIAA